MSTWEVKAWVQAPGEFPSWALETVTDDEAASAVVAALHARAKLLPVAERCVVVSVVRVSPPVGEQPS